jgi:Uma2 family endonuclease
MMATAEALELLTAEEFGKRPDPGHPEELVRGRVVAMPVPDRRHGYVCGQAYYALRRFVDEHDLGRVMSNDAGIITERGPDTVRGADVCYYSYARLPKGPLAKGYGPEVPELVVEVRSSSDRWGDVQKKVAEYLDANVLVVVVLDPERGTAHVFSMDEPPRALSSEDELTLPGLLEGFRVRVGRLFE